MKRFHWLVLGVALSWLGLDAAGVAAGEQPKRIELQPRYPGQTGPLLVPDALAKLKLSAEQKAKYDKIDQEYQDKAKAASKEITGAIQGRDRATIQQAYADSQKVRPTYLGKVETVLNDEQKKILEEVKNLQNPARIIQVRPLAPAVGGPVLPPDAQAKLKLTPEQKKKVDDMQKELERKILDVLTDEQKKQYEDLKKGPGFIPLPRPVVPLLPKRKAIDLSVDSIGAATLRAKVSKAEIDNNILRLQIATVVEEGKFTTLLDVPLPVAKDAKFLDAAGKELKDGLKAKIFDTHPSVLIKTEKRDGKTVAAEIRLQAEAKGRTIPGKLTKVDADKGTFILRYANNADAGGAIRIQIQLHQAFNITKETKLLDADGKTVKDGLKAKVFQDLPNVIITLDEGVVREIRVEGGRKKEAQ